MLLLAIAYLQGVAFHLVLTVREVRRQYMRRDWTARMWLLMFAVPFFWPLMIVAVAAQTVWSFYLELLS